MYHWSIKATGSELVSARSSPCSRRLSASCSSCALAKVDFCLPEVRHIRAITQEGTSSRWQVDTDRGLTEFVVDQEDHVRPLDDGRHLISDAHGMRYLVPVPSALDAASRKLLSRFS